MKSEPVEIFPCDICLGTEAVEIPYARLYTNNQPIHICKNCGFVYVQKRRSAQAIADSWSDEIYGEGYTARIPAVKARQTYVTDFINVNLGLKGKNLCDIGGGEGQFLEIARGYGAKLFAIEPSKKNCETLTKLGAENFYGTIEEYTQSPQSKNYSADIVTIMWTLENCRSCRDMIQAAYRIVKEGGHITIATGSRLLVPFKKPLETYLSTNPADTHAFRWSSNSLRAILAICGFEVTHTNRYMDSDILCMIAKKREANAKISWQKDDWLQVHDFFERWHRENVHYRKNTSNF